MNVEPVAGMRLYYEPQEEAAAHLIRQACQKSACIMQERWGLKPPPDCRVYVMTSWMKFLFQSAPWSWKIYLVLTLPLVAQRARVIWQFAGGWALSYGRVMAVGIKPPRLIETADRRLGEQLFRQDRSTAEVVETVTCHELVHAFTAHLKLPTWLQEGLATRAMEHYVGRSIVREEALEALAQQADPLPESGIEKLRTKSTQAMLGTYARGYLRTRELEEQEPEKLREILAGKRHL